GFIAFSIAAISTKQIALAATVGISLFCVVSAGNIVGVSIPLFFRLIKLDPAFVSAPLIATLLDATGLIIYFEIARRVLLITTH
ncbi:MAG: magnesium transporter, partial [Candidatus Kuenenia sp.]|nr:magnesium transporter [Candidatus Kuenenia sp.]